MDSLIGGYILEMPNRMGNNFGILIAVESVNPVYRKGILSLNRSMIQVKEPSEGLVEQVLNRDSYKICLYKNELYVSGL